MPDLHLLLVGRDCCSRNQELANLLRGSELVDNVHLLGARFDVPAIMNALDIHVLSSAHGEAFPNVVAEAMACGTPCVVTDVGDASEIVGATGWVVPPEESRLLGEAIKEGIDEMLDPGKWEKRRRASRERIAEHFSIETMVHGYHRAWLSSVS